MPNFVKIGHLVAKILRFFDFSRWRPSLSWILEIVNFYLLTVSGGLRRIIVPNFCQNLLLRCGDIAIFRILRCPPAPSWIFEIAIFYWLLRSRRSSLIIVPNFVKIVQSVAKILRFFDFSRWWPSAILVSFEDLLDRFSRSYHQTKGICVNFLGPDLFLFL